MLTKLYLSRGIRHYRCIRGLSQQKLADLSGVKRLTVCRIEAAQANPTLSTVEALAFTLQVSVQELFRHRFEPEELSKLKREKYKELNEEHQKEIDEYYKNDLP